MAGAHPTTRLSADELCRHGLTAVSIAVIGIMIVAGLGLTQQAIGAHGAEPDVATTAAPARGDRLVAVAASTVTSTRRDDARAAAAETSMTPTPSARPSSGAGSASAPPGGTSPSGPASSSGSAASSGSASSSGSAGGATAPSKASTSSAASGEGSVPSGGSADSGYLDTGAAVAAKASNGPAAPDFDKALVQLSAKEREAGQQTRAEQATQANTELEQDKRTVDQAGAATNIRSEQARLVDEKKKAEAAAALLKAQQDALAAAKQSASSASNATSAGSVTLPDGTLVRPSADGTWPPEVLTALAKFGKTLNGAGSKAIGKAVTPIAPGSYSLGSRWGAVGIWATYHTGQDFVAPIGTPIRAAADGVVLSPIAGAWAGTHVIIAHSDGSTLYAHMLATTVTPGQTVHAGDVIGFVGLTGRTTGAHLHFEFYPKGSSLATPYSATDPLLWLASRGVTA